MQTPQSQEIVKRFFEALQLLKAAKVIRGKQTFTRRYGINRWNMNTLEKDPSRDIFQPAWLTYLVEDYDISPLWLLTGKGSFYASNSQKGCKAAQPPKKANSSSCRQQLDYRKEQ